MKKRKFNTPKTNLIIDAIMLILLAAMTGAGFLIKYVLVPGFKRNVLYGSNVELFFWGLDRHQWGTIHLCISLAFLFLIIIHIILHWKMIVTIYRRIVPGKLPGRLIAVSTGTIILAVVIIPLMLKPDIVADETKDISENYRYHEITGAQNSESVTVKSEIEKSVLTEHSEQRGKRSFFKLEVKGSMTLDEVCSKYSVPVTKLENIMGIPNGHSSERIGRLKKRYGFETEELKNAVIQIKNDSD